MSRIFFTSDTHYGHSNIVRGTSDWTDKSRCRPFDTVEEHDDQIVNNINNLVSKQDVLYHLGDWSFGGRHKISEFRERINCDNIHLILGNHDLHIHRNVDNLQSLFTTVSNYKEITVDRQKIIMCHYAMRVWNLSHRGSWMLYGHSHGTLAEYCDNTSKGLCFYKTTDVGMDTSERFEPYSFYELQTLMSNRMILDVDHHNNKTT